jgi:hypothetical protein
MRKSTYIGGFGQAVKPLLNAEEFTGDGNGLRRYNIRVAWNRSSASDFFLPELAVSRKSASFHLMQCSLRDPRLLSLLVRRETWP